MLDEYVKGYAVLSEDKDGSVGISFESSDLEACKRYCRHDQVIREAIPKRNGVTVNFLHFKKYWKPFHYDRLGRRFNIFRLHVSWQPRYMHEYGKVVYWPEESM